MRFSTQLTSFAVAAALPLRPRAGCSRRARRGSLALTVVAWSLVSMALLSGSAGAQVVHDGFDPGANAVVRVIEQMRDGRLLLGGDFTQAGGLSRTHLARVDNTGAVESGFNVSIAGAGAGAQTRVRAIRHQAGGQLLIGGRFGTVAGQPRVNIARLTSAGALDSSFQVPLNGDVHAFWDVPEIPGGLLYVGGDFDTVHGQSRHRVARLNADGTLSAGFAPPQMNGGVWTMQPHERPGSPNGLLVAGSIGEVNGQPIDAPIVRLSRVDGSVDTSFHVSTSSTVFFGNTISEVAVQPDGRILIAGHFDTVHGQPRANLARLHPDGSLDESFVPPAFNAPVNRVRVLSDGRIVVAGNFTNSPLRRNVARLKADGSWDTGFNSLLLADRVDALAVQADGKLVVGGLISQVGAYPRENIARLYADGSPEVDFEAGEALLNRHVWSMAVEPDGRLLVGLGGSFPDFRPVLRVNRNGTVVNSFTPALATGNSGFVNAITVQPDGRILVGASGSAIPARLRRLHPDGSIDNSFAVEVNGGVSSVIHEPDGSVVFSGSFSEVNGQSRDGLARVDANGQLDPSFVPTSNGAVLAIARQADGKLVIGGNFFVVNSVARTYVARLNADGSLDTGFQTDLDFAVYALAVQNDGRILIGGAFDNVNGQQRRGIARLNSNGSTDAGFAGPTNYVSSTVVETIQLMPNGQILFAGSYHGSPPNVVGFLRRLSAAGVPLDSRSFDETGLAHIRAMAIDRDGHVYVGGGSLANVGSDALALERVPEASFALDAMTRLDESTVVWRHRGAGAALNGPPQLQVAAACCNDDDFQPVDGAWFSLGGSVDQWTLNGLDIAGSGMVWLRARGMTTAFSGGQYPVDSPILAIDLGDNDVIFADGFE